MNKNNLFRAVLLSCFAFVFIACNSDGGSASSVNNLGKNDILGDIPNILYQHRVQDSIMEAKYKEDQSKLSSEKESDIKKSDQLFTARNLEKEKRDFVKIEAIAKEKPNLIGKAVPFEVAEGVGYKVSNFVITDVLEDGQIRTEFQVEITNVSATSTSGFSNPQLIVTFMDVDKNGNQIGGNGAYYINVTATENGGKGTQMSYITIPYNEEKQYVNFAKIRFIK